jgi:hypothetical protein
MCSCSEMLLCNQLLRGKVVDPNLSLGSDVSSMYRGQARVRRIALTHSSQKGVGIVEGGRLQVIHCQSVWFVAWEH